MSPPGTHIRLMTCYPVRMCASSPYGATHNPGMTAENPAEIKAATNGRAARADAILQTGAADDIPQWQIGSAQLTDVQR